MDWNALLLNTGLEILKWLPQLVVVWWPLWLLPGVLHLAKFGLRLLEQRCLSASGVTDVDGMDSWTFEKYLETLFTRLGHRVELTKYVGDFGADLVTCKDGMKTVIQAKSHKRSVGVKAVQEAVAAKGYYGCDAATVVTNSTYTRPAQELARANGVILGDRERLMAALLSVKSEATATISAIPVDPTHHSSAQAATTGAPEPDLASSRCADCGNDVSEAVRAYCASHPERSGGEVYRYDHQRSKRKGAHRRLGLSGPSFLCDVLFHSLTGTAH